MNIKIVRYQNYSLQTKFRNNDDKNKRYGFDRKIPWLKDDLKKRSA